MSFKSVTFLSLNVLGMLLVVSVPCSSSSPASPKMCTTSAKVPLNSGNEIIANWSTDSSKGQYGFGIDDREKHSGAKSALIRSIAERPDFEKFGKMFQSADATMYRGRHLKMTVWTKTDLAAGCGVQFFLRVDGEKPGGPKRNCLDNMYDRPVTGKANWKQYSLVVDVPENSDYIDYGCMLRGGPGTVWIDDISLESVDKTVPLTGGYLTLVPTNLDFESK